MSVNGQAPIGIHCRYSFGPLIQMHEMTEETRCAWSRLNRRWIIGGALLLAVSLGWWNFDTFRIWAFFVQARATPLPVFDAGKAAQLTAARRAELERELFTELYMWNTQSRRYQEPGGLEARERRWREMVDEGYELAYLALTVFEPSTVQVHHPLPALRRLEELAGQGDAGAMCMYSAIVLYMPQRGGIDWSEYRSQARHWMQVGAKAKHPDCLIQLGGRRQAGSDGFAENIPLGRSMLFEALASGYLRAAGSLWGHFDEKGLVDFNSRRLVYCWGFVAASYRFSDADLSLQVYRNNLPPDQRRLLDAELGLLRNWQPTSDECVNLTKLASEE